MRPISGCLLEEEDLADDDQRKGDSEHPQHALVATGLLLGIAIFSQSSGSVQYSPPIHQRMNFVGSIRGAKRPVQPLWRWIVS